MFSHSPLARLAGNRRISEALNAPTKASVTREKNNSATDAELISHFTNNAESSRQGIWR